MWKAFVTRGMILVLGGLLVFTPSISAVGAKTKKRKQPQTKPQSVKKASSSRNKPARPSTTRARRATRPRTVTVTRNTPLKPSEIKDVEQRLQDLGYWTGPVDGKLDETSRSALIAFQKVTGRSRNGTLTRAERSAVLRSGRPQSVEGGPAHIEVDLRRQVLFVVDDNGIVTQTLPVSTGNGKDFFAEGFERTAVTPPGRFTIQGKVEGWKKSALGRLYFPNYIIGGIAIHGYPSVPAKPASHGCIRIPMFAAKDFSRRVPRGTLVVVHDGLTPEDSPAAGSDGKR